MPYPPGNDEKTKGGPPDAMKLEDSIRKAAKEGRISCASAFKIAAAAGMSPAEVGKVIEKMGVKIVGCQLGCFK
jgi:hypothetical protein